MENSFVFIATTIGVIGLTTLVFVVFHNKMGGAASNTSTIKDGKVSPSDGKKKDEIESKDKYPRGKMSIYFGSQTGTAEGFARTLMEEGKAKGYDTVSVDLEDFNEDDLLSAQLAIFLMATYGEGEPTDNATAFYKWLQSADANLNSLSFSVFGLGNKQYEHFNRMGKITDKTLSALGAVRVHELGLGDDDGALEDDFDNWKENLWNSLLLGDREHDESNSIISDNILTPEKRVELSFSLIELPIETVTAAQATLARDNKTATTHSGVLVNSLAKHFFQYSHAKIKLVRELRTGDSTVVGSTLHVELDLLTDATHVTYQTADNLAILPDNPLQDVELLAKTLGYDLNQVFEVKPMNTKFKYSFPTPCSIREALTHYFDIKGYLRPSSAALLIPYLTDPSQSQWLKSLLAKENGKSSHYKAVIEEAYHNLVSLVCGPKGELSSLRIPFVDLLHILPVLQPRYFTIASSSCVYPSEPHLTVAISQTTDQNNNVKFKGLCSYYLETCQKKLQSNGDLTSSSELKIFIKESSFRLPASLAVPVILIGPGTGFAPMRALLQERQHLRQLLKGEYGRTSVYFGCKRSSEDHIYKDEMEQLLNEGVITQLYLAYSRETEKKVYVQHLMLQEENASQLWQDLQIGGYVFVCGATTMGSDVNQAIQSIAIKQGLTTSEAEDFIAKLKDSKRYVQELWN